MRHLSKITLSVGLLLSGSAVMAQKPAQPLCEQPVGRCVDAGKLYTYGKTYVGHDEPSLLFYSNSPGSGNSSIYLLRLPTDPPILPKQDGTGGTFNFQLHIAPWFGMAMCDSQSFPEYTDTCTPDSDSNIFDNIDPDAKDYFGHHPGSAFMEMQFYPPGWVAWPAGISCDATHYCGALNIDSYGFNPNTNLANNNACLYTVGIETVNFAFITKSGVAHAPASPVNSTLATFTPNPDTDLFMSPGDVLRVTLRDTPEGFRVNIEDLTTGQTGSMTASAANGFGQVKYDPSGTTCENIPYSFHPMYSTSSEHTRVPWAAHSYNIAFSDEIGHFEYCDAVDMEGGNCTEPGVNDPDGLDSDDTYCFDAAASTRIKIGGCISADLDFDGPPYLLDWPGTLSNVKQDRLLHPAPIQFTSPLFISTDNWMKGNYSRVAFETDQPSFEPYPPCNVFTAVGCTNPPAGAQFYPLYTTTQAVDMNTCVWQYGGAHIPYTTNTFGGTSTTEFGSPLLLYFPEPHGYAAAFEDFRQILESNPCPHSGPF
jgi:hypothetical protein